MTQFAKMPNVYGIARVTWSSLIELIAISLTLANTTEHNNHNDKSECTNELKSSFNDPFDLCTHDAVQTMNLQAQVIHLWPDQTTANLFHRTSLESEKVVQFFHRPVQSENWYRLINAPPCFLIQNQSDLERDENVHSLRTEQMGAYFVLESTLTDDEEHCLSLNYYTLLRLHAPAWDLISQWYMVTTPTGCLFTDGRVADLSKRIESSRSHTKQQSPEQPIALEFENPSCKVLYKSSEMNLNLWQSQNIHVKSRNLRIRFYEILIPKYFSPMDRLRMSILAPDIISTVINVTIFAHSLKSNNHSIWLGGPVDCSDYPPLMEEEIVFAEVQLTRGFFTNLTQEKHSNLQIQHDLIIEPLERYLQVIPGEKVELVSTETDGMSSYCLTRILVEGEGFNRTSVHVERTVRTLEMNRLQQLVHDVRQQYVPPQTFISMVHTAATTNFEIRLNRSDSHHVINKTSFSQFGVPFLFDDLRDGLSKATGFMSGWIELFSKGTQPQEDVSKCVNDRLYSAMDRLEIKFGSSPVEGVMVEWASQQAAEPDVSRVEIQLYLTYSLNHRRIWMANMRTGEIVMNVTCSQHPMWFELKIHRELTVQNCHTNHSLRVRLDRRGIRLHRPPVHEAETHVYESEQETENLTEHDSVLWTTMARIHAKSVQWDMSAPGDATWQRDLVKRMKFVANSENITVHQIGWKAVCPRGHYLAYRTPPACVACSPGTYSSSDTDSNQTSCLPCPLGTFQYKPGQTDCIACPTAHQTAIGASGKDGTKSPEKDVNSAIHSDGPIPVVGASIGYLMFAMFCITLLASCLMGLIIISFGSMMARVADTARRNRPS